MKSCFKDIFKILKKKIIFYFVGNHWFITK